MKHAQLLVMAGIILSMASMDAVAGDSPQPSGRYRPSRASEEGSGRYRPQPAPDEQDVSETNYGEEVPADTQASPPAGNQEDAVTDIRFVGEQDSSFPANISADGKDLVFEVDYTVGESHGELVYLGGLLLNEGEAVPGGFTPISVSAPGHGTATITLSPLRDPRTARCNEVVFYLYEPYQGYETAFAKMNFPYERSWDDESRQQGP